MSKYQQSTHSLWVLAMIGAGLEVPDHDRTGKGYRTTLTKHGFITKAGDQFELTPAGVAELDVILSWLADAPASEYLTEAANLLPAVRLRAALHAAFPNVTEVVTSREESALLARFPINGGAAVTRRVRYNRGRAS